MRLFGVIFIHCVSCITYFFEKKSYVSLFVKKGSKLVCSKREISLLLIIFLKLTAGQIAFFSLKFRLHCARARFSFFVFPIFSFTRSLMPNSFWSFLAHNASAVIAETHLLSLQILQLPKSVFLVVLDLPLTFARVLGESWEVPLYDYTTQNFL